MGRGRAKAKQTKVARQLKYGGPDTDLSRLQAELSSQGGAEYQAPADELDEELDEDDPYAKYALDEDDDFEDEDD